MQEQILEARQTVLGLVFSIQSWATTITGITTTTITPPERRLLISSKEIPLLSSPMQTPFQHQVR